jgi:hypothetical protein
LTLSDVLDLFERPVVYTVRVRRDEQTLTVRLAPRRLV